MLQEIEPRHLDNQYHPVPVGPGARICVFRDKDVLVSRREESVILPDWELLKDDIVRSVYLFSVDEEPYFLAELREDAVLPEGYMFDNVRSHRRLQPKYTVYAEMTAWHLYIWYRDNCFCGRCGHRTVHDGKLRMLSCPDCGNMIFPKICPAIIVGVINGDHILLTKYSGRAYKNYALIAGFTEIGETAEDTVRREVFEEAGVHVKNIRYWGTQPWGIDSDLLLGYFADLDGSAEITMDREELSVAGWFHRDEMDIPADDVSLTNDMIRAFIENRHPR
ncbi:MAG: NAD(+) diphosphatase [Clostridia bacterium]|nr:NAD(+) diphosphatase [Clostridia bacterium]